MLTIKTGILHEVDHEMPISKGGKHHEDNLQVLTWMKNNEKSDKLNTGIVGIKLAEIREYYSSRNIPIVAPSHKKKKENHHVI